MKSGLMLAVLLLCAGVAAGEQKIFDVHVHLRDGEASLQKYYADVSAAKIAKPAIGAMWFGLRIFMNLTPRP